MDLSTSMDGCSSLASKLMRSDGRRSSKDTAQSSLLSLQIERPPVPRSPLHCTPHRGGLEFGPTHEMEGLRLHKLAVREEADKAWLARRGQRQLSQDRRIQEHLVDGHSTARRRAGMATDHIHASSCRDCMRMMEVVGYDMSWTESQEALAAHRSRVIRQAWLDRDEDSQRIRKRNDDAERRYADIRVEDARKQRELRYAQVSAMQDIKDLCRRHRRMVPQMPHSARPAFNRLTPAHSFKPVEHSGQFCAQSTVGPLPAERPLPKKAARATSREGQKHLRAGVPCAVVS